MGGGGGGGGGGGQQAYSLSSKHKLWNFHRYSLVILNVFHRWLAETANYFGKWLAIKQLCSENGQWPAVILILSL